MPLFRRFVLAFAAAFAIAGPAAAQSKDELVIGMTQYPATFHPSIESMLAKSYVLGMVRRPITVHGVDWRVACMMCVELPTIENGLAAVEPSPMGRGVALTYTLHPEARWGDGTPVSTEDVLFTWEVGRHPMSGIGNFELYKRILGIDVKDAKTFTIHFDRLTFDYNAINDFQLLPAHIERKAFAEPAEYRNRTAYDADPTNPGLYNGPYRVTEVARGSHVVMEPNPQWWGDKPHFRRIVVRTIENTAALEANLLSGAVDYVAGELGLTIDQALAFERRHGQRFEIVYKPGLVFEHIDVNLANPVLVDGRLRQALMYGLDRQALVAQLFAGRQPVAHTSVNPLDWVHAEDVPTYGHDPARAAALLDEAGWRLGAGGLRRDAAGKPLSIELMTTAGNRSRELVQQVLQSQWRRLGIEVRLRNEPARVFFGETVSKRKFPGLALFAWVSAPESVPRTTLHSTMIPTAGNGWAGQNYTGYSNPEADELIDAIEVELDRGKRKELWRRLQHIYARDLPALPLFFRADPFIFPKWLKGIEPTGHQYPTTLWVEHWRVAG